MQDWFHSPTASVARHDKGAKRLSNLWIVGSVLIPVMGLQISVLSWDEINKENGRNVTDTFKKMA